MASVLPSCSTWLATGSLYALITGCSAIAFARDTIYRDETYAFSVTVPPGLRICPPAPSGAGHGLGILLDGAGTCEAGVPKRVVVVDAEPNTVGAAHPSDLERFFCRSGTPLPVPLIVTRALRPGDDACSYRRGTGIAVWVLRQRGQGDGPGGGINEELGLVSDVRHYAVDLLAYRNLLVRVSLGPPPRR